MDSLIDANTIRRALEDAYCAPEWYLGFEVGNSTGTVCRRFADAVAVNAYPSKGFEVRGFEIKVSKSDLAAELKEGVKSDEIARFCDYWFLVTPPGLSDTFTLPPTWGVIEYGNGSLRQKVKAEKLERLSPTPGFLCAMLRGRERVIANIAKRITKDLEEQVRREASWSAKNAEKELKIIREKLKEIKDSTGIVLEDWTPTKSVICRLNAIKSLEIIEKNVHFLERAAKNMVEDAQEIKQAVDAIKLRGGDS